MPRGQDHQPCVISGPMRARREPIVDGCWRAATAPSLRRRSTGPEHSMRRARLRSWYGPATDRVTAGCAGAGGTGADHRCCPARGRTRPGWWAWPRGGASARPVHHAAGCRPLSRADVSLPEGAGRTDAGGGYPTRALFRGPVLQRRPRSTYAGVELRVRGWEPSSSSWAWPSPSPSGSRPIVRRLAERYGAVVAPDERRVHTVPTRHHRRRGHVRRLLVVSLGVAWQLDGFAAVFERLHRAAGHRCSPPPSSSPSG